MSTRKYPSRYEKLKKKNNKKQEKKIESQKAFIDKFVINIKQDTKKKKKRWKYNKQKFIDNNANSPN